MVTTWLITVGIAKVATALGTGISSNRYFSDCSSIMICLLSATKSSAFPTLKQAGKDC